MVPFLGTRYVSTFRAFDVNRAISILIHGSELVAVAHGLVEYWDYRWIFLALGTIQTQNCEHDSARGMSRATTQLLGPTSKCVRRMNLRPSSVPPDLHRSIFLPMSRQSTGSGTPCRNPRPRALPQQAPPPLRSSSFVVRGWACAGDSRDAPERSD